MVQLILLDVNDNSPDMPVKSTYFVSENIGMVRFTENDRFFFLMNGVMVSQDVIDDQFYAPDKDEFNTPNSWVSYEILSILPGDE